MLFVAHPCVLYCVHNKYSVQIVTFGQKNIIIIVRVKSHFSGNYFKTFLSNYMAGIAKYCKTRLNLFISQG